MPEIVAKPIPQQPINGQSSGLQPKKKRSLRNILIWVGGVLVAVIISLITIGAIWYNLQLAPVGNDIGQFKKIVIVAGSTPSQISKELKAQSIIRSATAFDICIRLIGKTNNLKAGTYRLSPSDTTPQIIDHILKGSEDQITITFFPGATLTDKTTNPNKYDVTTVLKNAGYSDSEITAALKATYVSPLFEDKPPTADLEGYIYGETYNFNSSVTVQDIFKRTFEEFYTVVQDKNLIKSFASHGLNLYEGITLASIVQREANTPEYQKTVAQVFYSRIKEGMTLGSDATYQYIADKKGVARNPYMISPYNTRNINILGLTPGPIAVPSLSALLAVAQPAESTYLYFLSDPDGKLYFAYTNAEHEANIVNHCKEACSTP